MDYLAEFCNVCRNKNTDNYVNIRKDENKHLLEILVSFLGSADIIQNVDVYLCPSCCKQLHNYKEFREMCVENLAKIREAYFQAKSKLESEMNANTGKNLAFLNIESIFESEIQNESDSVHDLVDPLMIKKEGEDEPAEVLAGEELGESGVREQIRVLPANLWQTKFHAEKDVDRGDKLEGKDRQDGHTTPDTTAELSSNWTDDSLTKDNCSQGVPPGATEEQGWNKKSARLGHERVHSRSKSYNCDVCACAFAFKSELVKHRAVHSGEKPYKCEMCARAYAEKRRLLRHKRVHTGETPYKCEVCARAFFDNSSLVNHKRQHTGERPYKCEECGRAFAQKSSLVTHRRVHTGEKPYKCEVCPLAFAERASLDRHKRVHTGEKPYKCEVCAHAFSQNSSLVMHRRVHTGERPYKCEVCEHSFKRRSTLQQHKRLHSD